MQNVALSSAPCVNVVLDYPLCVSEPAFFKTLLGNFFGMT